VSELERARSVGPPFTPPARPAAYVPSEDAGSAKFDREDQREGLPPGFRMRHDAHYVDQLTTRAAAPQVRFIPLRDIDGARPADDRDLGAMVRSIGKYGVLQPLLVRPRAGRFDLIAGARRLAAAATAGLSEVPCLVHQVDDAGAHALA
jgi:ParB family transcriptional regulator, chromosome partitioning protein